MVAVTNSFGTSYVSLALLAAFASPATNVSVSGSLSSGPINVSWTAPATAYEPIAGYNVELDWTDSGGVSWSTFGSTAAGVTSFSMAAFPGVVTYTVTDFATDAAATWVPHPQATTYTLI